MPGPSRWADGIKRLLDCLLSLTGLLVLSPVFFSVALLVRLSSPGPIFFRQQRIGLAFRPFFIYKFRTMVPDAPAQGRPLTAGGDPRITRVGHFLRRTKLDELPQLLNVLRGDMSLVGPRPEVPCYVQLFREDYEIILQVRPGITDLASITYRDEATLLGQAEDPEQEYIRRILPEKMRLATEYVRQRSLRLDLLLIAKTILNLVSDRVGVAEL